MEMDFVFALIVRNSKRERKLVQVEGRGIIECGKIPWACAPHQRKYPRWVMIAGKKRI